MPLSRLERKDKLGHGGGKLIAKREKKSLSYVSQVLNGRRRNRKIEVAIARRLGLPVDKVFPRYPRKKRNGQARVKRA
jgi:hypothetical protein